MCVNETSGPIIPHPPLKVGQIAETDTTIPKVVVGLSKIFAQPTNNMQDTQVGPNDQEGVDKMVVKETRTFASVEGVHEGTLDLGKTTDGIKPIPKTHASQTWANDDVIDTKIMAKAFAQKKVANTHSLVVEGVVV